MAKWALLGTVAGNLHMDQFAPLLRRVFGPRWFERGSLSLRFLNATTDGEAVRAFAEPLAPGARQTRVWMKPRASARPRCA